jgi:hypothetical protein
LMVGAIDQTLDGGERLQHRIRNSKFHPDLGAPAGLVKRVGGDRARARRAKTDADRQWPVLHGRGQCARYSFIEMT